MFNLMEKLIYYCQPVGEDHSDVKCCRSYFQVVETHMGVGVCDLFTSKPKIKRDVSGCITPNHSEIRPTDERESER